jgi:hypothetical protein
MNHPVYGGRTDVAIILVFIFFASLVFFMVVVGKFRNHRLIFKIKLNLVIHSIYSTHIWLFSP